MGGHALEVLPVMWVFVAIVFVFVGLRLYTRIRLIDSLRPDDYAYTMSSVSIYLHPISFHRRSHDISRPHALSNPNPAQRC